MHHFSLAFPFSKASHIPLFQIHGLSSHRLLLHAYIQINIHMYSWIRSAQYVCYCMFPGLTIQYWKIIWYILIPEKDYFSCSQYFLVAYSSLYRLRPCGLFLFGFTCLLVLSLLSKAKPRLACECLPVMWLPLLLLYSARNNSQTRNTLPGQAFFVSVPALVITLMRKMMIKIIWLCLWKQWTWLKGKEINPLEQKPDINKC